MSATRDRPQAQAPRPFMPKLASASPTTFSRSPPKPRLAGQTISPSVTTSLQARRPLTAINTPPASRQSPSNGRFTPNKVGADVTNTPRPGYRPGPTTDSIIPTSTMVANSRNNYTPPLSTARPRLARGATTPSLPSLNARTNIQPRRVNGAFSPLVVNCTASPVSPGPNVGPYRIRTTPPVHTAPFFHADDVPARSPSPEPPFLDSMMGFVYARGKDNHIADSSGIDQEQDENKVVSMQDNIQETFGPTFIDAASAYRLKNSDVVSTLHDAVMHGTRSDIEDEVSSTSTPGSPSKRNMHVIDKPIAAQNAPQALSKRLSGNGQPRQTGLDVTFNPPKQGKARSASIASSTAMAKPGQTDTKPVNAPTRPGLRSNRSSVNPTEPTSPLLNALESPRSTTQPEPTNHPGGIASSARHERKLLDLEISNSSLLAINRTLEREVAKQKAELKRLRRATMDRISWMSDTTEDSSEVGSRLSSHGGGDDGNLLDEHEADGEDQSRHLIGSKLVSRRNLQLDFSKHRELLVENHKMNMSLQKCLGITDTLIKEGDEALGCQYDSSNLANDDDDQIDDDLSHNHHQHWQGNVTFRKPPPNFLTTATNTNTNFTSDPTTITPNHPSAAETFFQTWGTLSIRTSSVSAPSNNNHENKINTNADMFDGSSSSSSDEPITDRDSGIDVGYTSSSTCASVSAFTPPPPPPPPHLSSRFAFSSLVERKGTEAVVTGDVVEGKGAAGRGLGRGLRREFYSEKEMQMQTQMQTSTLEEIESEMF